MASSFSNAGALLVLLVLSTAALPTKEPLQARDLHARRLLGTSFGVPGRNATFDYVVVGGGNAGLAIATRLAEQQSGTVAVVEAGSFYEIGNGNLSQVPAYDGTYAGKALDDWQPLIDWGYATTAQKGGYEKPIHYVRGKCLGGSSARHYTAYHRSSKGTYQRWAEVVDDDSYEWDKLLPFFEKSLHFFPPDMSKRFINGTPEYDASVLGTGAGSLSLSYSNYVHAFGTWATIALESIGLPKVPSFQSGNLHGQAYNMLTINATTGIRESSATAFLPGGLKLSNYFVYQSAMVKRVLFDDDKRASGVLIDTQGFEYILSANKEVILSSGAIGSPQLLMLSGIGPASTLNAFDIPIIVDRPGVGQHLEDHVVFGPSYRVNAPTFSSLNDPAFEAAAVWDFNKNAAGMLTNPTTDVIAFEKLPESYRQNMTTNTLAALSKYPKDWPEVEYLARGAYFGLEKDPKDGFNYASLVVAGVAPGSRGYVTISSADANDHAIINPRFLTDRTDIEVLIAGFKRAREFFASETMQRFVIGEEIFPGPEVQTDDQIEDMIRKAYVPIWHAASTCKMGKANDTMAVVDSHARVFGVEGLRVVDASAFPFLVPGHPQSTIYALAEKIACDITEAC